MPLSLSEVGIDVLFSFRCHRPLKKISEKALAKVYTFATIQNESGGERKLTTAGTKAKLACASRAEARIKIHEPKGIKTMKIEPLAAIRLSRRSGLGFTADEMIDYLADLPPLEAAKLAATHNLMPPSFALVESEAEAFADWAVASFLAARGWIGYRFDKEDDILAQLGADSDDIEPAVGGDKESGWSVYQDNKGGESGNEPTDSDVLEGPFATEAEAEKECGAWEEQIIKSIRERALALVRK